MHACIWVDYLRSICAGAVVAALAWSLNCFRIVALHIVSASVEVMIGNASTKPCIGS